MASGIFFSLAACLKKYPIFWCWTTMNHNCWSQEWWFFNGKQLAHLPKLLAQGVGTEHQDPWRSPPRKFINLWSFGRPARATFSNLLHFQSQNSHSYLHEELRGYTIQWHPKSTKPMILIPFHWFLNFGPGIWSIGCLFASTTLDPGGFLASCLLSTQELRLWLLANCSRVPSTSNKGGFKMAKMADGCCTGVWHHGCVQREV